LWWCGVLCVGGWAGCGGGSVRGWWGGWVGGGGVEKLGARERKEGKAMCKLQCKCTTCTCVYYQNVRATQYVRNTSPSSSGHEKWTSTFRTKFPFETEKLCTTTPFHYSNSHGAQVYLLKGDTSRPSTWTSIKLTMAVPSH